MKNKITGICLLMFCASGFASPCETKRHVFIENDKTHVWKTTICPNHTLPYHTHNYPRVLIPAENGTLKVRYQSGKEEVIHLKKETPILLSKLQGKSPHQDINIGKRSIHVTVIELR